MPDDIPDDGQDRPPEDTTVTCTGGVVLPTIGASDGTEPDRL